MTITSDSSHHACIFFSQAEALGYRHRIDKELELPSSGFCKVSMTKTKRGQVKGVCKRPVTLMGHSLLVRLGGIKP